MPKKKEVFIEVDDWLDRADQIGPVLAKAISEYKQGQEALDLHKKWEPLIRQAASDYAMKEPLFERNSATLNSLRKLQKSYKAFMDEIKNIPTFAKLLIDTENDKAELNSFEGKISDIDHVISTAIKAEEKRQHQNKAEGIVEVQNNNRPLDAFIVALLEAYLDISGRDFGLSRHPETHKATGPILRFTHLLVKIFQPEITEEALFNRIKQISKRESLLNN